MKIVLNRRKLLWVLSSAVDLVGVTDLYHGKRVAYIANQIRSQMEYFPWSEDDVIIAGLLHDCGVSSTDIHEHLLMEMEWIRAQEHCIRGEKILRTQDNLAHLASAIGKHHTRWNKMVHDDDALLGGLLFLSDRIDVLAATAQHDILIERYSIIRQIQALSGTLFSPELVEVFSQLAETEIFWLNWAVVHSGRVMDEWLESGEEREYQFDEFREILRMFSYCVDGKSKYTYNHSIGVAALARKIAELAEMDDDMVKKIELAGLIHDLGKLRVPDSILNKQDRLDDREFNIIRHHSFDTHNILLQIPGIEDITRWASQHHEKLNGRGYPEGLCGEDIPMASRIIAIADIFQALAQDRPYRKGMTFPEIETVLREMKERKEIDDVILELIEMNSSECMEAALTVSENMIDIC